jgi:hypothetical protein
MKLFANCATTLALMTMLTSGALSEEKRFTRIGSNVVVANKAMSDELRKMAWKTAENVWQPTMPDAARAVAHLGSEEGKKEILTSADPSVNMGACLKRLDSSRYQVFGLVVKGRKQLLIEASPAKLSFDRYFPDLWLNEIISVRVFDGGAAYWWVLFDVESGGFVDCNCRPV